MTTTEKVIQKIDLVVSVCKVVNEDNMLNIFDDLENENSKLACCYLLMACESHERKA